MLDLGSGVAGGARGWVAGKAGLWGVPPTWVWVVGVSLQILEHPTGLKITAGCWPVKMTGHTKFQLGHTLFLTGQI